MYSLPSATFGELLDPATEWMFEGPSYSGAQLCRRSLVQWKYIVGKEINKGINSGGYSAHFGAHDVIT